MTATGARSGAGPAGAGGEEADLRASRARIVAAGHHARRTIERRLHDGPQQHLVALAVKVVLAEQALDAGDAGEARRILAELRGEVQATVQQLRDLATMIYPPLLADHGLGQALRAAAARAAHDVDLTVDDDGRRYPPEVEEAAYFSCLEAIEAATGAVVVAVGGQAGALVVDVRGPLADGPALTGIADRLDTLGGSVSVERRPEGAGGLHLVGRLPL